MKRTEPSKPDGKSITTSGRPDVSGRVSVADLDRHVSAIREIAANTAAAYHAVGAHLADVHARQLWKLRTNGKQAAFKSFEQWAHRELGISPDTAANMIAVARAFTVEQIKAFGRSKLELVTRMPREIHASLLEQIRKGATYREVRAVVRDHKRATGFVRGDDAKASTSSKRTRAATKARMATAVSTDAPSAEVVPIREEQTTLAVLQSVHKVKLFARPASLSGIDWSTMSRARTLDEQPFGRLDLPNGVALYLSVAVNRQGELFAVLQPRRLSGGDDGERAPQEARKTG